MKASKVLQMALISLLIGAFCVSVSIGGTVPPGKRIELLAGAPREGTLQTNYLTIVCNYTLNQGQLSVSGKLDFLESLTMSYPGGLQQFYMEVLLLDDAGEVIERRNVLIKSSFSWGDAEAYAAKSFKAQISAPGETKAMTFYYNGVTQASATMGGGFSFWFDPSSGINR